MPHLFVTGFLGFGLLWNIPTILSQAIITVDNCTCKATSDGGIYSLWPLRRTDGKPRFRIPGSTYPNWRYTYNPCTPVNVGQDDPHASQVCRDVALCKYAEIEDPREYFEVGLQKGFSCVTNQKGQVELQYDTHDKTIDNPHSSVVLLCDQSASDPIFDTVDEDNYKFSLKHYCACKNRCSPPPEPTTTVTSTTNPPTTNPEPTTKNYSTINSTTARKSRKEGYFTWIYVSVALVGALIIIITSRYCWKKQPICCAKDDNEERAALVRSQQVINNINISKSRNSNVSNAEADNSIVDKKKNCNSQQNNKLKENEIV